VLTIRPLTPALWPEFERLFGERGACGGCWCMTWRLERGEKWEDVKGAPAKRRMKSLVLASRAHGLLAFDGGEPVGWCALGRRTGFARLDRAPSLACDDAARVWSIPCFFIRRDHRGRGVATALLAAAVEALENDGAEVIEGYPANPKRGKKLPDAFAWTGLPSLFRAAGFRVAGNRGGGKLRMRRAPK
jgi:GNAT superfamily N-acetyltransferase